MFANRFFKQLLSVVSAIQIQNSKPFVRFRFRAATAIAAAIMLVSCAAGLRVTHIDPFGIIGSDAHVYLTVPVKGNEPLLERMLEQITTKKTARRYLSRTVILHAGLNFDTNELRVCSLGTYPIAFSGSIFSKRDGWEKKQTVVTNQQSGNTAAAKANHSRQSTHHIQYYHAAAAGVDITLAVRGIALLHVHRSNATEKKTLDGTTNRSSIDKEADNNGGTHAFLQRIYTPDTVMLPARFKALTASYTGAANTNSIGIDTEKKYTTASTIGICSHKPAHFLSLLLGTDAIRLPVRTLELYFTPQHNRTYRYNAVLTTNNSRTAFLLKILAGKFFSTDAVSIQDAEVIIENGVFTIDELAALLRLVP